MATGSSNRDVKLTLSVETLGSDEIAKLKGEILKLGEGAGEAAPEFRRLAAEIDKLSGQADVARKFAELGARVTELGEKQTQAAASAAELRTTYETLSAATQAAAQRQAAASQDYVAAKTALSETGNAIKLLRADYDAAGKKSDEFKGKLADLLAQQTANKTAVDATRVAQQAATRALSEAGAEEAKALQRQQEAQRALNLVSKEVDDQTRAFGALAGRLSEMGVASGSVAQAQAAVIAQFNGVGQAALSAKAGVDALRAAEKEQSDLGAAQAAILAERNRVIVAQFAKRQAAAQEAAAAEVEANRRAEAAAKEYVAQVVAESARLEAVANEAAAKMDAAFGSLGLRSVQSVKNELAQVRAAMTTVATQSGQTGASLNVAMEAGRARVAQLEAELRKLNGAMTEGDKMAGLFGTTMGQFAAGNLIASGVAFLIQKVRDLGVSFVETNIQAQNMRLGLTAIYKDADVATSQINFLKVATTNAGVSMGGMVDSFVKFSAATASANIPLKDSNALFEAVMKAGTTLGLSTERVGLSMEALAQMAGKGVVSMEELRQQLSDNLPGALSLSAKALGITDGELIKLVETGRMSTRDFFPALTQGLNSMTNETETLTKTWGAFKNMLTLVAAGSGESVWMNALTLGMKVLGSAVGSVAIVFSTMTEAIGLVGRGIAALSAGLTGTKGVWDMYKKDVEESNKRLKEQSDALNAMLDPSKKAKQATQEVGQAAKDTGSAVKLSADELKRTNQGYADSAAAAKDFAGKQTAVQIAIKDTSAAGADLSSQWVKLGVDLGKLEAQQEADIVVRSKGTKAAKEQATEIQTLAELRGDEMSKMEASIQGNALQVKAADDEASARQALAATLATELEAKTNLAIQQDGTIEKRKQDLDLIKQKLDKAVAEADASTKEADALHAVAAALDLKSKAMQDNSGRVDELRAATEKANVALADAKKMFDQGVLSTADYKEEQRKAAIAAGLLKDALNDQSRAVDANTKLKNAQTQIDIGSLQILLEKARGDEAQARRLGNETLLRQALIKEKEIELQIDKLKLEVAKTEAQGSIEVARAKLQELNAAKDMDPVKRAEIAATIALAQAKLKVLEAQGENIKQREIELQRIKDHIDLLPGENSALGGNSSSYDSNTDSVNRNTDAKNRNAAAGRAGASGPNAVTTGNSTAGGINDPHTVETRLAENQQRAANPYGMTDAEIRRANAAVGAPIDSTYSFRIRQRVLAGDTFTEADLPGLRAALAAAKDNARTGSQGVGGLYDTQTQRDDAMWVQTFQTAIDRATSSGWGTGFGGGFNGSGANPAYTRSLTPPVTTRQGVTPDGTVGYVAPQATTPVLTLASAPLPSAATTPDSPPIASQATGDVSGNIYATTRGAPLDSTYHSGDSTAVASSSNQPIVINLNGVPTTLNVASVEEANALVALLQQLAGRSGP